VKLWRNPPWNQADFLRFGAVGRSLFSQRIRRRLKVVTLPFDGVDLFDTGSTKIQLQGQSAIAQRSARSELKAAEPDSQASLQSNEAESKI